MASEHEEHNSLVSLDSFPDDKAPWSSWTKRILTIIVIIAVVIGLLLAGTIYTQVIYALVLCLLMFAPIRVLTSRTRLSYGTSATIVFVIFVAVILFFIAFVTVPVVTFVGQFVVGLDDFITETIEYLEDDYQSGTAIVTSSDGGFRLDLSFIVDPISEIVNTPSVDSESTAEDTLNMIADVSRFAMGLGGSLLNFAYNLFFISLLTIMMLLELPTMHRWLVRNLSYDTKRQYGILLQRFDSTWTGYLWSTAIISLIGAVLTWGLLTLTGIPNQTGITVITTIVLLIPFFGPSLGTIIVFLASFLSGSSVIDQPNLIVGVIVAALFFFLRGFVVGNFVYPRIVGKSLSVSPVIVLIALSFFGSIGGIVGMFLSPVIAAFLRDLSIFFVDKLNNREPFPEVSYPDFMLTDAFSKQHDPQQVEKNSE